MDFDYLPKFKFEDKLKGKEKMSVDDFYELLNAANEVLSDDLLDILPYAPYEENIYNEEY